MKVLEALLNPYYKSIDEPKKFVDYSTKETVQVGLMRRKHLLLLISDLDVSHEVIELLKQLLNDSREKPDGLIQFEVIWMPVVDMYSRPNWSVAFEKLRETMPWLAIHPTVMIQQHVINYIKEELHFTRKPIVVTVDPQGRVTCKNALHMLWIWGNKAFPFSDDKEAALWKTQTWNLDLLVPGPTDADLGHWVGGKRLICLYGGENIKWIREFTGAVKAFAKAASFVSLGLVYVGKSSSKKANKIASTIKNEQLSHCWPASKNSLYYCSFWARLESMLYSKLKQYNKANMVDQYDTVMKEIMTILSLDGSDHGWAIFCEGSSGGLTRAAKGETALRSMLEYRSWFSGVSCKDDIGMVVALNGYLRHIHDSHHCFRLVFTEINWGVPDKMKCIECGRQMEKNIMYCC